MRQSRRHRIASPRSVRSSAACATGLRPVVLADERSADRWEVICFPIFGPRWSRAPRPLAQPHGRRPNARRRGMQQHVSIERASVGTSPRLVEPNAFATSTRPRSSGSTSHLPPPLPLGHVDEPLRCIRYGGRREPCRPEAGKRRGGPRPAGRDMPHATSPPPAAAFRSLPAAF